MMNPSEDDLIENANGLMCFEGRPFSGITEDFYEDGQIAHRRTWLNGLQHGLQQDWYGSGQISMEESSCMNQLHGYRRAWHPNGKLAYETLGEHGHLITHKEWDEQGNLTHDTMYGREAQDYEAFLKRRTQARTLGYGPPDGVDPRLLPPEEDKGRG